MGSALSKNRAKAAESTETTLHLQEACRKLSKDVDQFDDSSVTASPEHATPDAFRPMSSNGSTYSQLGELKVTLSSLEQKLRARGHWHPPHRFSQTTLPTVSNISDLSDAVKDLTAKVDSTHPFLHTSPRQFFAGHAWHWDPTWKEFYTYIQKQHTYIYLSLWQMNAAGQWFHLSMAGSNITAAEAMDLIGSWEDWTYDPVWREWYIPVQGEKGDDANCCIYASPWQDVDGLWYYMGRIGGTG